jgi:serine/threonine protein kinase
VDADREALAGGDVEGAFTLPATAAIVAGLPTSDPSSSPEARQPAVPPTGQASPTDDADYVALLEEVRVRREGGEDVDLGAYREQLGVRWEGFRDLLAFDEGFTEALDEDARPGMPRPFGRYTLLREVGAGAIGIVYEAHDTRLDRRVALKVLRPEFEADREFRLRYEREARTCAQVRHANLVEIYECGEVNGRLYYAMPFLEGGTLADLIRDGRLPATEDLCLRMAGLADAVSALHAADIVHRDIKPSNIIVEEDGRLVLADFGLARRVDLPPLTRAGQRVGTPQYMSPEQLAGRSGELDHRTDVYALGATLYHALSGRVPFPETSYEALGHKLLSERPPTLHRVSPEVPFGLSAVVMKCLERSPADRYASAGDLADDLRAIGSGRPVVPPPVSPLKRLLRRMRWWHAAAGVLVLGLAFAVLLGLLPGGSTSSGGQRSAIDFSLPANGRFDSEAVQRLMAWAVAHGVPMKIRLEDETSAQRAAEVADVQLLFPRGAVRREDLDTMRVDVSEAFEGGGSLVFRSGEQTLASIPFVPRGFQNRLPVPQAVRDVARVGTKMTWAYEPEHGASRKASFEIVAPDLAPALSRIDELTSFPGRSEAMRPLLRAFLFLDHRLGVAAYRELEALDAGPSGSQGVGSVDPIAKTRLRLQALHCLFEGSSRARHETSLYNDLHQRLDELRAR